MFRRKTPETFKGKKSVFKNKWLKILLIIIFGVILYFQFIVGYISEKSRVQAKIDDYLEKHSEEMNKKRCALVDTGNEIILWCGDDQIEYNETHDKVSWYYETSGGAKSSGEFFIPHFNPVKKSENLMLMNEGPYYRFFGSNSYLSYYCTSYDDTGKEKKIPYKIMTVEEAEYYNFPSKERCLDYKTDRIREHCLKCLLFTAQKKWNLGKEYCDDFKEYPEVYSICIGKIASYNSNLDICINENNAIAKNECFFEYARGHRDKKICKYIDNLERKEICERFVIEIIADVGPRS